MPTRAEKTLATRRRMLEAAGGLFVERGFTATSVKDVARAAGVAEQTVYFTFGTKLAVLSELLDRAVAGDGDPVPTLERPWARAVLADPDPVRQLQRQAAGAAAVLGRCAPVLAVLHGAAAADPAAARLRDTNAAQRHAVQLAFAQALATKAELRRDVAEVAQLSATVLGPETWQCLVLECSWTPRRWVEFTTTALAADVLGVLPADLPGELPEIPGDNPAWAELRFQDTGRRWSDT